MSLFQYQQSYQYAFCYNYLPFTQRRTGHVKFFNLNKGYGFIIPDNNESTDEVFVHHTSILNSSKGFIAVLQKGEHVEYELHHGPKGIYALHVTGPKGRPVRYNPYQSLFNQQTKSGMAYHYVNYVIPYY